MENVFLWAQESEQDCQGPCRGKFQGGSVNRPTDRPEAGNEVFLMGGFHPIGNANKGLLESAGGAREEPGCDRESQSQGRSKLSGCGFSGRRSSLPTKNI